MASGSTLSRRTIIVSGAGALVMPRVALASLHPAVVPLPGRPGLDLGAFALESLGYEAHEFLFSGLAHAYELPGAMAGDGVVQARRVRPAPYVSRLVVIRPSDPRRFNGTVIVEWLNVTNGGDMAADWTAVHREILRTGGAYVGVSAQKQGVDGLPVPGAAARPLKIADPARYAGLTHPGDAYAYDIFSQAAQVIRSKGRDRIIDAVETDRLIAIGVSQSAAFLVSYVNAVEPLASAYDGFLIHSRFGTAAPFDGTPIVAIDPKHPAPPVRIRTDRQTPVMIVETETDVIGGYLVGYHAARQPAAPRLLVWEVAGSAHVDTYATSVGAIDSGLASPSLLAERYRPSSSVGGLSCSRPINAAPQTHYVLEAALSGLDRWIRTGVPPHGRAKPIELVPSPAGSDPKLVTDALGIAKGGVRTPWVDVPIEILSGVGNSGTPAAFLFGVTEPLPEETREQLYAGKEDYLTKFEAALTRTIAAGFLLPSDRQEILTIARATAW